MQVTERSVHYKFKITLFLFVFWGYFSSTFGQQFPDRTIHSQLSDGINKIIDQDYTGAEQVFARMVKKHPDLPAGNIYLAAVKIARSVDYGEPFNQTAIQDRLDRAEEQCKMLLKKDDKDVWHNYFYALLKGYSAYYNALKKDYISAFANGVNSISYFEKCLQADSSFYESYLALGTYKYWKSEKTEFLEWLPFITDERETGIKFLETTLQHKSYNSHIGIYSLVWIYLNNKQPDKAISLAEKALSNHPNSRFFKWTLAAAYERKDKHKAISVYRDILNSILQLPVNNRYNEIVLKHKIAMLHHDLGENRKALEYCNEILRITGLTEYTLDRLENRLERVQNLQKELTGS